MTRPPNDTPTALDLIASVVSPGYCIGCGACAAVADSPLTIVLDQSGRYVAALLEGTDPGADVDLREVCPFASIRDEDAIAEELFAEPGSQSDRDIGTFKAIRAGAVKVGDFRRSGSSGGMVSWTIAKLFQEDRIDAVIHVGAAGRNSDGLFTYRVSRSVGEAMQQSKSRYYPVEMSHVLEQVRREEARYAIVGVPCFVKAVRLLQEQEPLFRSRIVCCIGLVCGHMKSAYFASAIGWEMGIQPGSLTDIDFRTKTETPPASVYRVSVAGQGVDGKVEAQRLNRDLLSYDWGFGFFKYEACDFCDDVFNETADISLGDAWVAKYEDDPGGTNIVITRSAAMEELLNRHISELDAENIDVETARSSQAAGLRHRKEGLAWRLFQAQKQSRPVPRKRVRPSKRIAWDRRRVYDLRSRLMAESYLAYEAALESQNFGTFASRMESLTMRLKPGTLSRLLAPARALMSQAFGRRRNHSGS